MSETPINSSRDDASFDAKAIMAKQVPIPPDKTTLLLFIGQFVGWRNIEIPTGSERPFGYHPTQRFRGMRAWVDMGDYTRCLNLWHRDVWPILEQDGLLVRQWYPMLAGVTQSCQLWELANASAYDRCLALWYVLDGKVPAKEDWAGQPL